jgi:hypothetical protein
MIFELILIQINLAMKKIILTLGVVISAITSFSQETTNQETVKRNTFYVEAFGQGLYNSLTFDRLYRMDKKIKTSFSGGLTLIPSSELFVIATPFSYNYLLGQNNHKLELGLGATAMFIRRGNIRSSELYYDNIGNLQEKSYIGHEYDYFSYLTLKVGYRYQKPEGGAFFRATFTPTIAGINLVSAPGNSYRMELFENAAFFGQKVMPWAGVSFGWTFKK